MTYPRLPALTSPQLPEVALEGKGDCNMIGVDSDEWVVEEIEEELLLG